MRKNIILAAIGIFLLVIGYLAVTSTSEEKSISSNSSKIGVIEINGAITGGSAPSIFSSEISGANDIMQAIRKAAERRDIKAVVLRINSPGGTAGAAQEIGIELDKLRHLDIPIVTSMGDMCASGGYWIACSSDYIVANGATLTGSIGVIMELANLEGLYEKLGISPRVIKSGEFKDIGSPTREMTEKEKELLQDLIDDSYEQFLDQVRQGRKGKILEEEIIDIADGRIFSGRQALDLGLVDSLGNYYDAIEKAEEMAGIPAGAEIEILNQSSFWDLVMLNMNIKDLLFKKEFLQIN
ncbi:MAG TPA: signal peptide peptidase SppA [Syntrophomonadaceae bacterium]|nr:signal peptide peptidase SppA [Syntrophomonadaceae bacterium]